MLGFYVNINMTSRGECGLYITVNMASQGRSHAKSALREEGLEWQGILAHTMKVHVLPEGQPYTANVIKAALLAYRLDVDDIELVGPLAQHKTWQVVFATKVGHDAVLAKSPFLDILTSNGRSQCEYTGYKLLSPRVFYETRKILGMCTP